MLCSGCGKEIPFAGEVCPYCQRDKTADKGSQMMMFILLFIFGGFGYLLGDFKGLLWGAGIALVLGVIIALKDSSTTASQPPLVRVVPPTPTSDDVAPTTDTSAVQKRLTDLEALRSKGLISEDEFQAKRQKILDEL